MMLLSWLAVPADVNTVLIAGCVILAIGVAGVMIVRPGASPPGSDEQDPGPVFDPMLFVSALAVIGLAIVTYLAR